MNELNELKTLREVIAEAMGIRGFNAETLAEMSDIPVRYINAFLEEDFSKLPPAPYIRGYLAKLGDVLNLDSEVLLETYKNENANQAVKSSGAYDKLPSNRFVAKPANRVVVAIIIIVVLAIFLIFGLKDFFGTPGVEITSPAVNNFTTDLSSIKLIGKLDNSRDKLTINGEEILIGNDGFFEHEFSLQSGINTIEFNISRFLGKETRVIKQVIYNEQP